VDGKNRKFTIHRRIPFILKIYLYYLVLFLYHLIGLKFTYFKYPIFRQSFNDVLVILNILNIYIYLNIYIKYICNQLLSRWTLALIVCVKCYYLV